MNSFEIYKLNSVSILQCFQPFMYIFPHIQMLHYIFDLAHIHNIAFYLSGFVFHLEKMIQSHHHHRVHRFTELQEVLDFKDHLENKNHTNKMGVRIIHQFV